MSDDTERTELFICGRTIGTHDGHDQTDIMTFIFYKFQPIAGDFIPGDLQVDFDKGILEICDVDGNIIWQRDLTGALQQFPRKEHLKVIHKPIVTPTPQSPQSPQS